MYDAIIVKPVSMSSKEISALTNKRHADVLRDIRNMLNQLYDIEEYTKSDASANMRYQEIQGVTVDVDSYTKRTSQIHLDKIHTNNLLVGYSAKLRQAVLHRLYELEADARDRAHQDYIGDVWLKNRRLASSKYVYMQEEVLESLENNPGILAIDAKHLANPEDHAKKQEANFINDIVIGMKAHAFRHRYGVHPPSGIRDGMPARLLQAYESLEDRNASLLNAGVSKEQRQKSLEHSMQRVFPDVVAFREVAALEKQYCVAARASKTFEYTHPSRFLELVAETDVAARLSDRTIKKLECDSTKKTLAQRKMELIDMISEVAVGDDETMFDD